MRRAFASTSSAPAYSYDPYGNPLQTTAPVTDFVYAGMFYNADSGLDLTQYRAYDPVVGRWLSRDPLGESNDPAANLYRYADDNPVSLVDPSGMFQVTIGAGGGYGAVFTFGYNCGQYNFGAYAGAVEGGELVYNPANLAPTTPGLATSVIAGAEVAVVRPNVEVEGTIPVNVFQTAATSNAPLQVGAAANFGPYSTGAVLSVTPSGAAVVAPQATFGFGAISYFAAGGTYTWGQ